MRQVGSAGCYKDVGSRNVLRSEPKHGTEVRRVYDLFLANPCVPMHKVALGFQKNGFAMVWEKLQDYGLDIRRQARGVYCMVGRHTESGYLDYVAGRVAAGLPPMADPATSEAAA